MKLPIYLDYAAATPADPEVANLMMEYLTQEGCFGNPASRSHRYGWMAEHAVERARKQVAISIGADPREIIWTSGATESNNLALKGAAFKLQARGRHIVTSSIEHKAVLDTCRYLEAQGFEVTYLQPDASGRIETHQVAAALKADTILVSLMWVNNELGTINPVALIAKLCRERQILMHTDAAQAVGKLPVAVKALGVDMLSVSAHKMYGPKGMGCLYVNRDPKVSLLEQIHGGGHERGMRSGTLPTHQIVGLGHAAYQAHFGVKEERARLWGLRKRFLSLIKPLDGWQLNGHPEDTVPGILNIGFEGVDGETLLSALCDIAVSSGSACTSITVEPSYVLRAIGLDDALALASIRFSFGRFTSEEDIVFAAEHVLHTVRKLRV